MKLKKVMLAILLSILFIAQFSFIHFNDGVYAQETKSVTTTRSCKVSVTPVNGTTNLQNLEPGDIFEVNVNLGEFNNVGKGIISLLGQLEYNTNVLERISITGQNDWKVSDRFFNEEDFSFIIDRETYLTTEGSMFTIKFKVKDNLEQSQQSSIKVKNIEASGGYGLITAEDANLDIAIQVAERITSDKYVVNNIDKDISRIVTGTTVGQFKENVAANKEIVILDKEENVLGNDQVIGTGMKIKVGQTLEYTAVVIGDTDGDGKITVNDLVEAKLHLIKLETLTGIKFKAANIDNDKMITVNDASQMQLVIVKLMTIQEVLNIK